MRFEDSFNNTPLGEIINKHLMTNFKLEENIRYYLRDFIFMKIHPDTEPQLLVSILYIHLLLSVICHCISGTIPFIESSEDLPSIDYIYIY